MTAQIKALKETGFTFDSNTTETTKRTNLVVFPLIITTHYSYQLSGVNSYLTSRMQQILEAENLYGHFKHIYPLTMIDFSFFFANLQRLKDNEVNLKQLIIGYQSTVAKSRKALNSKFSLDKLLKVHSCFSENLPISSPPQKDKNFVQSLFTALDINVERTTPKNTPNI